MQAVVSIFRLSDEWRDLLTVLEDAEGELTNETEEQFQLLLDLTEDKVNATCDAVRSLEVNEDAARAEASRMSARAASFARNAAMLRDRLGMLMDASDKAKIKTVKYTVSRTKARQSVEVSDVDALAPEFLVMADPKPNKTAISEALKLGKEVNGARFVLGIPGLTIR